MVLCSVRTLGRTWQTLLHIDSEVSLSWRFLIRLQLKRIGKWQQQNINVGWVIKRKHQNGMEQNTDDEQLLKYSANL